MMKLVTRVGFISNVREALNLMVVLNEAGAELKGFILIEFEFFDRLKAFLLIHVLLFANSIVGGLPISRESRSG